MVLIHILGFMMLANQGSVSKLKSLKWKLLGEMKKFFDKKFVSGKNQMIASFKNLPQGSVS